MSEPAYTVHCDGCGATVGLKDSKKTAVLTAIASNWHRVWLGTHYGIEVTGDCCPKCWDNGFDSVRFQETAITAIASGEAQ